MTGQADGSSVGPEGADSPRYASRAGIFGWVLYDWAAQPFYTLVITFLFAPFFANQFVSDPVWGQSLWGYAMAAAGLVVAFTSPVLGAVADGSGRRKPWVLASTGVLVCALALLWFAMPGSSTAIVLTLLAVIVAVVAAEYAIVFTNAMMADLVPPSRLGRLSGAGFSVGYAGGVLALLVVLSFVATDPATGKTMLGLEPLLPLSTATFEPDRLVGPLCALWLVVFSLPFFLFTEDGDSLGVRGEREKRDWRDGLQELKETLKLLFQPVFREILKFLAARMLYTDGIAAILTFGGIYGASVFGWGTFELGLFGIILAVMGAIGAVVGGYVDDAIGSKAVILGSLVLMILAALAIVSVTDDRILFTIPVEPKVSGAGAFSSTGEMFYLAFGSVIGLVFGPVQSASRSLMARMAPEDKTTQFFGLFAFSGKVTAFMAPLMVGLVTWAFASQRAGVAAIIAFLGLGFLIMLTVRTPGPRAGGA